MKLSTVRKFMEATPVLPKFEDCLEDDSWQLVTNRKPTPPKKVLFVGNLPDNINDEKLKLYTARRASRVGIVIREFTSKVFKKSETVSARIVVDETAAAIIKQKGFWPKPVYTRDWKFDKSDKKPDEGGSQTQHSMEQGV